MEQQFHKSKVITFVVWNLWSYNPSASGYYGRQADVIQSVNLNFLFLYIWLYKYTALLEHLRLG